MYEDSSPKNTASPTLYQIGIQDNGDTSFLRAAQNLNLKIVLIETPETLEKLQSAGIAQKFQSVIPVQKLEDDVAVNEAILKAGYTPNENDVFVSDGHDRCVPVMYKLSEQYNAAPANVAQGFRPPDKIAQRRALDAAGIPQPRWKEVDLTSELSLAAAAQHVGFPAVLKASDGCFGHGVHLVNNTEEYKKAAKDLNALPNFGGSAFSGFLLEQLVPHQKSYGVEHMVNGVVANGDVSVYSVTDKTNSIKNGHVTRVAQTVYGPHEPQHQDLIRTAQECIGAMGYKNGAFHIDLMEQEAHPDKPLFIEMGARPSGSYQVHDMVSQYPPIAEQMLRAFLNRPLTPPDLSKEPLVAGDLTALSPAELATMQTVQNLPNGVNISFLPNEIPNPNPANVGRMVVTAKDPADILQVTAQVADTERRFKDSIVPPPWEAALPNTYIINREPTSRTTMEPTPPTDNERASLLTRPDPPPQSRWAWIAENLLCCGTPSREPISR